ncbi:MAG: AraC family transcriptional regulator [Pseudomonadota bacterium]
MFHTAPLITFLSTMSLAVALTGMVLSLMQARDRVMFRVLAGFFFAIVLTEIGEALGPGIAHPPTRIVLNAVWIVGAASALPLLWLYISMLTSHRGQWPDRLWRHLISPGIALALLIAAFSMSSADRNILFAEGEGALSATGFALGAVFEAYALFLVIAQWLFYLILSARRLFRCRARLKHVFASTEGKELRWVAAIIGIGGAYWLLGCVLMGLYFTGVITDVPEVPEYALNLIVSGILVVWGLRQRPNLMPDQATITCETHVKYAKSALTDEMAVRIGAKLKRAMTESQLHLDPNLSLWALSKHVGVSDNYVSQVLNKELGLNFFDFVNGYRVQEAQMRLTETDETILNIAYDIGFNSRSSFYTAFKKVTGETPTGFRRAAVCPN